MNDKDREWLQRCVRQPDRYQIIVDNDCQYIEEWGGRVYDLCDHIYGREFALELLKYMGCNAESV